MAQSIGSYFLNAGVCLSPKWKNVEKKMSKGEFFCHYLTI